MFKTMILAAILGGAFQANAHESHADDKEFAAKAMLHNSAQKPIGHVNLEQGANGVLVSIVAQNIGEGWHAFHIHETGDCSGEGFKSAGGHAHGAHKHHGFVEGKGMHLGDMPNIWAHKDGTAKAQAFLQDVTLADLIDEDGSAVIVHAAKDDYKSQPSGAAGARIACGVITH